jgi:putative flippase GtrA
MAWLMRRVRAFQQSEHFKRMWKYASVSVVSTIVSQVVLFVTYHVWDVGHSAMLCNVIATAVASVPAYYLNRTWTWGKTGRSKVWGEVVPFWSISFGAMVLSTIAVGVAAHNARHIASGSLERAFIVNGANLVTYACIWTARYFLFNRYLFGARTQRPALAPAPAQAYSDDHPAEISVPVAEEGIALEPGLSALTANETVDPVVDAR